MRKLAKNRTILLQKWPHFIGLLFFLNYYSIEDLENKMVPFNQLNAQFPLSMWSLKVETNSSNAIALQSILLFNPHSKLTRWQIKARQLHFKCSIRELRVSNIHCIKFWEIEQIILCIITWNQC